MGKWEYVDLPTDAKQIPNTNNYVDPRGNVYGFYRGRREFCIKLKPHYSSSDSDYLIVTLKLDGSRKNKRFSVHRLVAEAFCYNDDVEHKTVVDHKNNNKQDNRAENLQWCTQSYNTQKAYNDGLIAYSPKVGMYDWYTNKLVRVFDNYSDAKLSLRKDIYIRTEKPKWSKHKYYLMYLTE